MNQKFESGKGALDAKGVLVGIVPDNFEYQHNADGTMVAFVQNNELWTYDQKADEFSLVFSFKEAEKEDPRNYCNHHEIHINSIDEEGVYIAKAEFVSDTLEEGIYYALDDSFSSIKASNIINKPLNKDDEAALFFEIINVDGSAPDFKGTLRLMMSNQNDWIEISAK